MKINILLAAILTVLLACENEDDIENAKETSLLTLSVDPSYPTDDSDDWIIVNSEAGDLLAYMPFESNQELEILTDKPILGKLTITYLNYLPFEEGKNYSMKSFTSIEKGKHLVVGGLTKTEISGSINISVSDVHSYQNTHLTTRFGTQFGGSISWDINNSVLDLQSSTFTGASKYISTVTSGNMYRYKVLDNVRPNETYDFSFDDMIPFEEKATFIFPEAKFVSLFVYGSDPELASTPNSFLLDWRLISNPGTAIVPEYINVLTNYRTELAVYYEGYSYSYVNQGSIPDDLSTWPQQSDFGVNEKSLSNFSAATSKPFVWLMARWGYSDIPNKTAVSWQVSSPSPNFRIKELPAEIIGAHPALTFDNFNYQGSTFYTQSPAYELFFGKTFQAGSEPTGEILGIFVNN